MVIGAFFVPRETIIKVMQDNPNYLANTVYGMHIFIW